MKNKIIFFALLIFLIKIVASAQDVKSKSQTSIVNDLLWSMSDLKATQVVKWNTPQAAKQVKDLDDNLRTLVQKIDNSDSLTEDYLRSINDYNDVIANLKNKDSYKEFEKCISLIKEDASIKLEKDNNSATSVLDLWVDVTISIVDSAKNPNNSGLTVYCNPNFFSNRPFPLFEFNGNINPYQRKLPPGKYSLCINKKGKKVYTQVVSVSASEKALTITIVL